MQNLLESESAGTTVHLSQVGFASEEAQAHGDGGWTMVLGGLKKLLEEGI